jgi:regulation of enolase protein 1 (concanavalin A-like superfamily)
MIRQSLDAGSIHASMVVTPGKGVAFQRRTAKNALTANTSAAGTAPRWLKVTRSGQTITAAVSSDGAAWTTVGGDTVPFTGAVWAGIVVSSHDPALLASATFDHVTVSKVSTIASGWSHVDIGVVGVAGLASSSSSGVFTLEGGGADIWGTADALQYAFKPLSADGQLVARVASVEATHRWAKAGVMIRGSSAPGAAQAVMVVSAAAGAAFQYRAAAGGTTVSVPAATATAAPAWVKIVRSGNAVSGYESSDGTTWRLVGSTTISLPAAVEIGLAVSSHTTTALCTATFDNVR